MIYWVCLAERHHGFTLRGSTPRRYRLGDQSTLLERFSAFDRVSSSATDRKSLDTSLESNDCTARLSFPEGATARAFGLPRRREIRFNGAPRIRRRESAAGHVLAA